MALKGDRSPEHLHLRSSWWLKKRRYELRGQIKRMARRYSLLEKRYFIATEQITKMHEELLRVEQVMLDRKIIRPVLTQSGGDILGVDETRGQEDDTDPRPPE